jgi:hypothetical protein
VCIDWPYYRFQRDGARARLDVGEDVAAALADLPGRLPAMRDCLNAGTLPEAEPGLQCGDPYPCEFWDRCTAHKPADWVFYLPRRSAAQAEALGAHSIEAISAIPPDFPLTARQAVIRNAVATGRPFVAPDLARLLRSYGPPTCYLDFEAMMPPIPALRRHAAVPDHSLPMVAPRACGRRRDLSSPEIAPGLKRAAFMLNPETDPVSAFMPSFETAARSLKIMPIITPVRSDGEIETAISALGREPGGGLVVLGSFMLAHRASITSAAARNKVPTVCPQSYFARDGCLLSYGADQVDISRRAASYVDRILRGAKPGDLPVQFPTKFEMVVNRKTATALGLAIPPSILLRADEVID